MALIQTGNGITDIRGKIGGVYYSRDRAGLHMSSMPRHVRKRTFLQDKQRKAFTRARAYSTIPRTVSYNIYRALTGLSMAEPPIDYPQNPPRM